MCLTEAEECFSVCLRGSFLAAVPLGWCETRPVTSSCQYWTFQSPGHRSNDTETLILIWASVELYTFSLLCLLRQIKRKFSGNEYHSEQWHLCVLCSGASKCAWYTRFQLTGEQGVLRSHCALLWEGWIPVFALLLTGTKQELIFTQGTFLCCWSTLLQSDHTRLCFRADVVLPLAQFKISASSFLFSRPELRVEVRFEPIIWSIFSLNPKTHVQFFYVVRSYACMGENTLFKSQGSNKLYLVLWASFFTCLSTMWMRLILVEDLDIDKLIWVCNKIPRM